MTSKIVHLSVVKQQREASQEALWQRFLDLKNKSQETGRIEDGVAAGKAYADFCESFVRRTG